MSLRLAYILPCAVVLAAAGCAPKAAEPDILDVTAIKQDCLAYIDPATADRPLIEPDRLARLNADFRRQWMRPWDAACSPPPLDVVRKPLDSLTARGGYGMSLRPHPPEFFDRLRTVARLEDYPTGLAKAITTRNTPLRTVPSLEPCFVEVDRAGEGFPFDSWQESALWAGTPLLLCHTSSDGVWVFVDSPCGWGWVLRQDVGTIDDESVGRYGQASWAALRRDGVAMMEAGTGALLFSTHIGAVFPLLADRPGGLDVLAPARTADGQAVLCRATVAPTQAAAMPVASTPRNIATLANEMLGQPYGWGGLYEGRDCSAVTRDLMTPLGIWLPRNSSQQAHAYRRQSLKGLGGDRKECEILRRSTAFLTLIRLPGHVGLYVGQQDGRALMLHSFWGIRTRQGAVEGRKIVGRCVITTLQPGRELPDLDRPRDYRDRIESIVFIGLLEEAEPSAP